jgi:hypothetical protein
LFVAFLVAFDTLALIDRPLLFLGCCDRSQGFQLQTVAPVASNGWVLIGEVDKFLPISRSRIASVVVEPTGGFSVGLLGAVGEQVTIGAVRALGEEATVSQRAEAAPVYATATIGADGTAMLRLR